MACWPQNELLARMVGEEDPHELMRDGGEPPIYGGLIPDHCTKIRATRNLVKEEKEGKRCGNGSVRGRSKERYRKNS